MKKKNFLNKTIIRITCIVLSVFFVFGLIACGKDVTSAPERHDISYPDNYTTHQDEEGADSFNNCLDHPDSRYYVINDYYNMKSDDTLHIISQFMTYQQTTEYSCGYASALMVLNHFGTDNYDEMQIGELIGIDETNGTSVEGLSNFFESIGWKTESHASVTPYFDTVENFEISPVL